MSRETLVPAPARQTNFASTREDWLHQCARPPIGPRARANVVAHHHQATLAPFQPDTPRRVLPLEDLHIHDRGFKAQNPVSPTFGSPANTEVPDTSEELLDEFSGGSLGSMGSMHGAL